MNLVPLILPDGFVCPFIELATSTDVEMQRVGLAGRKFVGPGAGMFFSFLLPDRHHMTMQGCLVDLDIIWLGVRHTVQSVKTARVGSKRNFYDIAGQSWAVLELAAGQAAAHGVIPGSQIRFVTLSV
jgi:uncharacterized membrane protein (UPF0127 family)